MKKRDKLVYGTIIGGAIGSVLGLMYAPNSGKKTRKKISGVAKKYARKGKLLVKKNNKKTKK